MYNNIQKYNNLYYFLIYDIQVRKQVTPKHNRERTLFYLVQLNIDVTVYHFDNIYTIFC